MQVGHDQSFASVAARMLKPGATPGGGGQGQGGTGAGPRVRSRSPQVKRGPDGHAVSDTEDTGYKGKGDQDIRTGWQLQGLAR